MKTFLLLVYRCIGHHDHDYAPNDDDDQHDGHSDHDDHHDGHNDHDDDQDNCQVPLNIVILLSFFYGIICLMALVSSPSPSHYMHII